MSRKTFIVFPLCILIILPISAKHVVWTSDGNSVHIQGIAPANPDNPLIYDNDIFDDMIDNWTVWAKASLGECNLVGIIASRETHENTMEWSFNGAVTLYNAAINSGWKNLPYPVRGSDRLMNSTTDAINSDGAQLIIREAKKCSPEKPLLVFCGGQANTPASAYLLDRSIADKMIVFHVGPCCYNGQDNNAVRVCEQNLLYVTMGDPGPWWPQPANGQAPMITQAMVDATKNDAVGKIIRTWKASNNGQQYADLADGGPTHWLFKQDTWNNMRNESNGQTIMISLDPYEQAELWRSVCTRQDIGSGSTGVLSRAENNNDEIATVRIYPNPARDIVNISKEAINISLYNIEGKLLRFAYDKSIATSNLKSGTYVLKATVANQTIVKTINKK